MDTKAVQRTLPKNQMDNAIRMIQLCSVDKIAQLRHVTYTTMKKLGVKRSRKLARTGVPAGSDQFDTGSLITWIKKVKPEHKGAVRQIRVIDATLCARLG